uniref:Uncharacterized protein n=1 Tax=Ananas comosus var. bracteatus TaxID=296719 RepID=A0A6V7PQL3_ANACO|nr:unnamed protein product [Ananas comosus var. bracteatus]
MVKLRSKTLTLIPYPRFPVRQDEASMNPLYFSFLILHPSFFFCFILEKFYHIHCSSSSSSPPHRSRAKTASKEIGFEYEICNMSTELKQYNQPELKLSSMRKSWSTDSLSTLSGGTRTCVCAPTTHVGSFRCRHHRQPSNLGPSPSPSPPHSLPLPLPLPLPPSAPAYPKREKDGAREQIAEEK